MKVRDKNVFDSLYCRILLFVLILIIIAPVYIFFLYPGLDPSWVWIFNYLPYTDYKFGTDIAMNWGPLAFVCVPLNMNNNIIISVVFWILIFGMQIYVLLNIIFFDKNIKKNIKNINILIAIVIFVFSIRRYETTFQLETGFRYHFQPTIPEYNLGLTTILSFVAAWWSDKKDKYEYVAIASIITVLFVKFSSAITVLSILAFYLLISFFLEKDKKFCIKRLSKFLAIPIIFLIGFLFYNPSVDGLFNYIKIAVEESSGYNYAMSYTPENDYIVLFMVVTLICIIIFMYCMHLDKKLGLSLLLFFGPYFLMYKHAYVRADHYMKFFEHFLMLFSIFILFFPLEKIKISLKQKVFLVILYIAVLVPCIYVVASDSEGLWNKISGRFVEKYCETFSRLENSMVSDEKLPAEILEEIGDDTVSIYPYELTYAAYNDLNFVPMPCLQSYTAYTPYLDNFNSRFFCGKDAPQYIIFHFNTIDMRIFLLDAPATWNEIKNNYEPIINTEGLLLLKRKQNVEKINYILVDTFEADFNSIINLPDDDNYYFKIKNNLSVKGKSISFLYKIEPVYVNILYSDGSSKYGRILVENMQECMDFSFLPVNSDEYISFYNDRDNPHRPVSIQFSGNGVKAYNSKCVIEVYRKQ